MSSQELALAEIESLTKRQQDVALLIAKGYAQEEAAEALFVSRAAVRWHLHNIFKRLGISKATQLAVICTMAGLVTDWEEA